MRYLLTADSHDEGDKEESPKGSTPYKKFMLRHEEYDAKLWEQLECLYRGGRDLLGNKSVMV